MLEKINDYVTYCLRNKIWLSKVVEKYLFSNEKKIQPDLTSFDPSKKLSAKIALKLYFRKNWGTKSVFSHYVHKLVRKSTFHILYIKLYINLFKIHCFWFFSTKFCIEIRLELSSNNGSSFCLIKSWIQRKDMSTYHLSTN